MSHYTLRNLLTKNTTSLTWDPESTAVVFEDQERTYGALSEAVDSVAAGLAERGFKRGDRLLVLAPNGLEYVEIFFAVVTLGGVVVPANYLLSPREIAEQWEDSGASWLVVHERFADGIEHVRGRQAERSFCIGDIDGLSSYEQLRLDPGSVPLVDVGIDEVALLQYTSGTSGKPKAATHTHASLLWNAMQQLNDFRICRDDVYVCVPALCWAAGFHDFLLPTLWMGGKVVLLPSQGFTPQQLVTEVERHGGTMAVLVSSVLRLVVEDEVAASGGMHTLRVVVAGGEALPVELIQQFNDQFPRTWLAQGYGMTEGPMIMTILSAKDSVRKLGSAGKALTATLIRVVDPDGRDMAPGEVGEIVVKSAGHMRGYAHAIDSDPENYRDGWFRTGDSGRLDADGYLYVVGRIKDMFISGGLNVYPAEVERAIVRHDAVLEAAVVGVPHSTFGEVGMAFVQVRPRDAADPDLMKRLSDHAREHLAGYKVPKFWEVRTDQLPRTASGKIQKSALRQLAGAVPR